MTGATWTLGKKLRREIRVLGEGAEKRHWLGSHGFRRRNPDSEIGLIHALCSEE